MILHVRRAAVDARTAALDVFAALRFIAALGGDPPRLSIDPGDDADDPLRKRAIDAWSAGTALVGVAGHEARDAAVATAAAVGAELVDPAMLARPFATVRDDTSRALDGRRLAARYALGIGPDETVELALVRTAQGEIGRRLTAFDEQSTATPAARRRSIIVARQDRRHVISAELIAAIVHPLVLVELGRQGTAALELARLAADEVIEGD